MRNFLPRVVTVLGVLLSLLLWGAVAHMLYGWWKEVLS